MDSATLLLLLIELEKRKTIKNKFFCLNIFLHAMPRLTEKDVPQFHLFFNGRLIVTAPKQIGVWF